MADLPEIYVSSDMEADGRIPGVSSMISYGSAAYTADGELISTFTENLIELPGATSDPEVMTWWKEFPEAWDKCRENPQEPAASMLRYCRWLESLPGRPVFLAKPATYDFMWIYWYLMKFVGHSPFGFQGFDMKTYAATILDRPFHNLGPSPKEWATSLPHPHTPLEDSLEQGEEFFLMRKYDRLRRRTI